MNNTPLEESFFAPVTDESTLVNCSTLNTPINAKTKASLNSMIIFSGTTTFVLAPNFSCSVSIKNELSAPPPVTNNCWFFFMKFN